MIGTITAGGMVLKVSTLIPGFRYDMRPTDRMPFAREFLPKNRTDAVLVNKTFALEQKE